MPIKYQSLSGTQMWEIWWIIRRRVHEYLLMFWSFYCFLLLIDPQPHDKMTKCRSKWRVTEWDFCMNVRGGVKRCILWQYIGKITIDSRLEEIKIASIRDIWTRVNVCVTHSSCLGRRTYSSGDSCLLIDFEVMGMICFILHGFASFNCEGLNCWNWWMYFVRMFSGG